MPARMNGVGLSRILPTQDIASALFCQEARMKSHITILIKDHAIFAARRPDSSPRRVRIGTKSKPIDATRRVDVGPDLIVWRGGKPFKVTKGKLVRV